MVAQICLRYYTRYCYSSDFEHSVKPLGQVIGKFGKEPGKVNITELNIDCLIRIFEFLPTQDLLTASMVCRQWHIYARYLLNKIRYLKITSPRIFERAICQYSPAFKPCSEIQYYCTVLEIPCDDSTIQYSDAQIDEFYQKEYYEQIFALMDRIQCLRISTLDVFDCPISSNCLSKLLIQNKATLQCLALDSVNCLYQDACFSVWSQINALPKLKKLALLNIGPYMPPKLLALGNLEEFHNDGCVRRMLSILLPQLGSQLRKLSLPFEFPLENFQRWNSERPTIVAAITHLKLLLTSQTLGHIDFTYAHFISLTHLYLIIDDKQNLYLHLFQSLSRFPKLSFLELKEYPHEGGNFTSMLATNYSSLASSQLKVFHFDIAIKQYRKLATLNWLFPELEEISVKNLDTVDCDCYGALNRGTLANCGSCRATLKSLLSKMSQMSHIYGIDVENCSSMKEKEAKRKCRFRWL